MQLKKFISTLTTKPKLLLHCCCAPCATTALEQLCAAFEVTAFYCNPNITDAKEYDLRLEELKRLCGIYNIDCIDNGYDDISFFNAVKGLENCKERGDRCKVCISGRLEKTGKKAEEGGFEYFATTLTLSPLKDTIFINEKGLKLKSNASYLPTDFKKLDGYKRSIELSEKFKLYRQNYCGCQFSKN